MIWQHLTLDTVTAAGAVAVVADLLNGPRYANARYAPTVAPQRENSLAGQATYADVEDEILVDVLGATPADAIRNAEALIGILGQAGEWWSGEDTTAIQVRAQLQGAAGAPPAAMVLGPVAGQAPAALKVDQSGQAGTLYVIRDVSLRFVRRGRWLAARETVAIAASTGNPTVETIPWATDQGRIRAPAGIELDISSGSLASGDGLILTADDDAAIQFLDLTTWSGAAQYTTVAAATSRPFQGTNLVRLTPAAANTSYALISGSASLIGTSRLLGFWLCARPSSSARSWLVTLNFLQYVAALTPITRTLPPVVLTGTASPVYLPLGVLAISGSQNVGAEVEIVIEVDDVTGAPTLDLSHLVVFSLDAPGANVLRLDLVGDNNGMIALPPEVLNAGRQGVVQSAGTADFTDALVPQTYAGDIEITTAGAGLAVAALFTDGSAFTVGSGSTKANFTFTGYRRRAGLTPQ